MGSRIEMKTSSNLDKWFCDFANDFKLTGLKSEFEGEGIAINDLIFEYSRCERHNLIYLIKIGGCEAKSDITFLDHVGVSAITAPMVETPFAISKYISALDGCSFEHIGVTVETITAYKNVDKILSTGTKLTNITIGRSDLAKSMSLEDVDSVEVLNIVLEIAGIAKNNGLSTTVGGSINTKTIELFRDNKLLQKRIDFIETRKVIMPVEEFLKPKALETVLKFESLLLERQINRQDEASNRARKRNHQIQSRL